MLKSWSIENFKPIINSGELKLAPVTVFAGLNSSGKSSLLQSILMIAQTLSSKIEERPLLPNGPLVQLGTFDDILNETSGSRELKIGFELVGGIMDTFEETAFAKVTASFSRESDKESFSVTEIPQIKLCSSTLEIKGVDYSNAPYDDKTYAGDAYHFKISIRKLTDAEYEELYDEMLINSALRIIRADGSYDYLAECIIYDQGDNINSEVRCLAAISRFLPEDVVQWGDKKHSSPLNSSKIAEVPPIYETNVIINLRMELEWIKDFFFRGVRYLSPLRTEPWITQRYAPAGELDDVGPKGEYASVVYHAHRDAQIAWYNPSTSQVETSAFRDALNVWARYLGVAHEVVAEEAGMLGITWKIIAQEGRRARMLPEIGVGVSQVLPILVMGLLAPSGALLLFEQPELHLHPRVQARLGDFFMGLAKCGKQCLIETHSENLINQLRYYIVQAGGMEKSDCLIYFVDQDEQGAAQFTPVEISPNGNILNWPEGFFDETMLQEDRITAESVRRRAQKHE